MTTKAFFSRLSIGDRLGEAFYALWMVVVSIGLLNSGAEITYASIANVILICFGVNLVWGIIDGVTVMYSNVIARFEEERAVHDLRARPTDPETRRVALEYLDDSIADCLDPAEKQRILAALAAGAPGPSPRARAYRATPDDWLTALSIIAIDVVLVVPVVVPLLLFGDFESGVYASRLVATALFAWLGWAYGRNLNWNPWLPAIALGALGMAVSTIAYEVGW